MNNNNIETLLQNLINLIGSSSDTSKYLPILKLIPFETYPIENCVNISFFLIKLCKDNTNKMACSLLLNYINSVRITIDPSVFFLQMVFYSSEQHKELILFIINSLDGFDIRGVYIDVMNISDQDVALKICQKLDLIYPCKDYSVWRYLYDQSEEDEDENEIVDDKIIGFIPVDKSLIHNFFFQKMLETQCQKPEWLKQFEEPVQLPSYPSEIPNVSEMMKFILDGTSENDDFENVTACFYSTSLSKTRIAMLSEYKKVKDFDDTVLFNEYGPLNSSYNYPTDCSNNCSKWGGCRMFLCNEYEDEKIEDENDEYTFEDECDYFYDDFDRNSSLIDYLEVVEEDSYGNKIKRMMPIYSVGVESKSDKIESVVEEEKQDWFVGFCQNPECKCPINNKYSALRIPLENGGWKGCYCPDEKCVKKFLDNNQKALLFGRIFAQLKELGIRDR